MDKVPRVSCINRSGDAAHDFDDPGSGKRMFLLDCFAQRLAFQQFHHEKCARGIRNAEVENRHDIGMSETCGQFRFLRKSIDEFFLFEKLVTKLVDHGPQGGDEINIVRPGRDYGWPNVTYGRQYDARQPDGRKNVIVGTGRTSIETIEEPRYYWVPSIAPSGMMFYTGNLFPAWKGNLFVGAMAAQHLVRLVLDGDKVVAEEKLLTDRKWRIREVKQGPDGAIYLFAGNQLVRLVPR